MVKIVMLVLSIVVISGCYVAAGNPPNHPYGDFRTYQQTPMFPGFGDPTMRCTMAGRTPNFATGGCL